jgi:hypothetical protein
MPLSTLRLEDISLFNYIKYEVLGYSFIEQLSDVALSYDTDLALFIPTYTSYDPAPNSVGRGWVPFDEVSGSTDLSSEQTTRVSVTGASTYEVNYTLGGIQTAETPTAASFYWNYVSVIDGWPDGNNPPALPIVAIDVSGSAREGFQIGPGYMSSRKAAIHVFASNSAERDDLVDTIQNSLYNNLISVVDYSEGDYLDYDGFFNSSFSRTTVSGVSDVHFDNISVKYLSFSSDWSDLNRYRATFNFTMTTYVQ